MVLVVKPLYKNIPFREQLIRHHPKYSTNFQEIFVCVYINISEAYFLEEKNYLDQLFFVKLA